MNDDTSNDRFQATGIAGRANRECQEFTQLADPDGHRERQVWGTDRPTVPSTDGFPQI
jgi:hypothetical protein